MLQLLRPNLDRRQLKSNQELLTVAQFLPFCVNMSPFVQAKVLWVGFLWDIQLSCCFV